MRFARILILMGLAVTGTARAQRVASLQTVEGSVTDFMTGAPIANAIVELVKTDEPGARSYRGGSDALGVFRIENVAAGSYRADFSAPGFVSPRMGMSSARLFAVRDTTVSLGLKLARAAKLSGKVIDAEDNPVARANVTLRVAEKGGFVSTSVTSDADGGFLFPQVSPGTYLLEAVAPEGLAPPKQRDAQDVGWARTFYPNAIDRESAAVLTLKPGWDLGGQNIRLQSHPLHRIRGNVVDGKGEPAPHAQMSFVLDSDVHAKAVKVSADVTGSFESPPLHDGGWRVSAQLEPMRAYFWIPLKGRDAERVELRLGPAFTVQGTIDTPNKSKNPGGCVSLFPENGGSGDEIQSDCSGRRDLIFPKVYATAYRIAPIVFPPGNYYLDSITAGEQNVMGKAIEMQPGMPPLRVIYRSNGGTIRGTVDSCNGATIVVVPQEASLRASIYYRTVANASCGANGTYQIQNLRPGLYYVFAFDQDSSSTKDFEELEQALINRAVTAHVQEGQTETADLKVVSRFR